MGTARWFHIILILSIFLFTAIRIHRSISYYFEEGYDEDASPSLTRSATNDVEDSKGKKKPLNILLLYADDWSYNTLGAMGNEYVQTPHLDELARQGVLFTHSCVVTSGTFHIRILATTNWCTVYHLHADSLHVCIDASALCAHQILFSIPVHMMHNVNL